MKLPKKNVYAQDEETNSSIQTTMDDLDEEKPQIE